jgi:hypothetical protein
MNNQSVTPIERSHLTAMKAFGPGSNVDIKDGDDELVIRIRPRYRIARLLTIPALLLVGLFGMAFFSFANMSAAMEGGNDASGQIFDFVMMLISGGVPLFISVVMLTVAFTSETLTVRGKRLIFRCTVFGIGRARDFDLTEAEFHYAPQWKFGGNQVRGFFGFSKARFLLVAGGKSRPICEDISDAGAQRVGEALRSRALID